MNRTFPIGLATLVVILSLIFASDTAAKSCAPFGGAGKPVVWAWGSNNHGQLGDGTAIDRSTPVQVQNLSGVTAVCAGSTHNLALKADGTVWAWGANSSGQLGDGTTINRS